MSYRITDASEVQRLIAKGMLPKSALDAFNLPNSLKGKSPKNGSNAQKISKGNTNSNDPIVKLRQHLVAAFGDHKTGGLIEEELSDVIPGRKWRLDFAIAKYKIGIEMDGWQYHGKYLKDFKRDRQKDFAYKIAGWLVIRVSKEMVDHEIDKIITGIKDMIDSRSHGVN